MSIATTSYQQLKRVVESQGYVWFAGGDLDLNLIGVRTNDKKSNAFNDFFFVAYLEDGIEKVLCFDCTTDPGLYYRNNPINVLGTAILKAMQHRRCWRLGMHKGKYPALVQVAPMTVHRDNNKDNKLDEGNEDTGFFGLNCHNANKQRKSTLVGKWSAGCQVIADPDDHDQLIALCKKAATLWGDRFSYTLLEEDQL